MYGFTVVEALECNPASQGTVLPMFDIKCISREAFEKNPHYMVYSGSECVATIWQFARDEDGEKAWCFVGGTGFAREHLGEYKSAVEAFQYLRRNWNSYRARKTLQSHRSPF